MTTAASASASTFTSLLSLSLPFSLPSFLSHCLSLSSLLSDRPPLSFLLSGDNLEFATLGLALTVFYTFILSNFFFGLFEAGKTLDAPLKVRARLPPPLPPHPPPGLHRILRLASAIASSLGLPLASDYYDGSGFASRALRRSPRCSHLLSPSLTFSHLLSPSLTIPQTLASLLATDEMGYSLSDDLSNLVDDEEVPVFLTRP